MLSVSIQTSNPTEVSDGDSCEGCIQKLQGGGGIGTYNKIINVLSSSRYQATKMLSVQCISLYIIVYAQIAHGQRFVNDVCSLKASGNEGVCKLFSDCSQAREDLQKYNRFPQTCGFEGTQPIVCCPENSTPKPQTRPGEVSKRKCRDYSAYVYERKPNPTSLIGGGEIVTNECGHKVVRLIVGGEPASRKEFPHMAVIGFEPNLGEIIWLCGGTIISKDYILTAAHCLSHYEHGNAKYARLGMTDLNNSNHRQHLVIAERIPYPEYRSSSHYHDIGLLKLEKSAKLNSFARPACLYLENELNVEKAIATGWGHTSYGGSGSTQLQKVTLDLFTHNFCNTSYKNQITRRLANGIVNDIQICAGSTTEEKDTCQGDSGGPLQIYHTGDEVKCMYDIIGVTSFGKACSGSPGVYVRVSHYIKWIEDTVWPDVS